MSAVKAIPKPTTLQKLTSVNEQVWLKLGKLSLKMCVCVRVCVCKKEVAETKREGGRGGEEGSATRLYFNFV